MDRNPIFRFLGGRPFLQFCSFLVLLGTAWFIYFSFIDKTNNQDAILQEIRKTQTLQDQSNKKIDDLQIQINQQDETIHKMSDNICVLQKQVISLGAIPVITVDSACIINK